MSNGGQGAPTALAGLAGRTGPVSHQRRAVRVALCHSAAERIVRGGYFENGGDGVESTHRRQTTTSLRYEGIGFRCAGAPEPSEAIAQREGVVRADAVPDVAGKPEIAGPDR